MRQEAFESAVSRYFDGELSPRAFAELEQYLESSEEARARYLDRVDIHNVAGLELSATSPVQSGTASVVPVERVLSRQRRRSVIQAAFAAAAVLVLMGVLFKFVIIPPTEPLVVFRVAPDSIFSVTHSVADGRREPPAAGTLEEGSRLELRQGTVELTLSTGVKSVVQAPANLVLLSEDRVSMKEGVAWFQVPKQAVGFKVFTPRMEVTDLGTEFGVSCAPETLDEVHLLKGKIEVQHRHGLKRVQLLSGSKALIAGPAGRLKSTPVRPKDFLTSLPQSLPCIHLSFDSLDGNRFSVDGNHPDVPEISASLVQMSGDASEDYLVPGKRGQALKVRGKGGFVLTDWPGISGGRARTVSCWVRMHEGWNSNPAAAILGWGSQRGNGKWKIHAVPDAEAGGRVARISLGSTWYSTNDIRIDDGEWHHLAAVAYGGVLKDGRPDLAFFVDGQRRALVHHSGRKDQERFSSLYTDIDDVDSVPLLIGKSTIGGKTTFRGEIDEVGIYDGALSDDSIRQLAAGENPHSDS